jgi:hypothetical protein
MATGIYHGLCMLSLATIVAHKNNGTVTPSGFVMGFCFAFDIGCLARARLRRFGRVTPGRRQHV